MNVRAAFAAGCVAACAIGAAQANAVYTYTGAEMDGTFFSVFGFPGCNCGSGPFIGPFSGSIDGTMTLSSPLAPHSNNVVVEPMRSHSRSSGLTAHLVALSRLLPLIRIYAVDASSDPSYWLDTLTPISVSTNGGAQVTSWTVHIGSVPGAPADLSWTADLSSSAGDDLWFGYFNHGPIYCVSSGIYFGSWPGAVGWLAAPVPTRYR